MKQAWRQPSRIEKALQLNNRKIIIMEIRSKKITETMAQKRVVVTFNDDEVGMKINNRRELKREC